MLVTNLENSKLLVEAKLMPTTTAFVWGLTCDKHKSVRQRMPVLKWRLYPSSSLAKCQEWVQCLTLSELMRMLPDHTCVQKDDWGWCIYFKGLLAEGTISGSPEESAAKYLLTHKS